MLVWGVIMAAMSACKNGPGLLAARFFLGLAEAGLFPGIAFYLSVWYPRRHQSLRISMVWASSTIAGVSVSLPTSISSIHCNLMHIIGLWRYGGMKIMHFQ